MVFNQAGRTRYLLISTLFTVVGFTVCYILFLTWPVKFVRLKVLVYSTGLAVTSFLNTCRQGSEESMFCFSIEVARAQTHNSPLEQLTTTDMNRRFPTFSTSTDPLVTTS